MNNFGTMFVYPLTTLKQHKMKRTHDLVTAAAALAFLTAAIGVTQAHNWTQLATAVFGAAISLGILGLIATEK
jgi:hypothetical protein